MKTLAFIAAVILLSHGAFAQKWKEETYSNGTKKAKGMVDSSGQKAGKWTTWYPDGYLNAEESYRQGLLHGKCTYYGFGGLLQAIENWHDGTQTDSARYWHPNGQLAKHGRFANSLYEGEWEFFAENGQRIRLGSYQRGVPHGTWTTWRSNGTIQEQGRYIEGKEDGEFLFFDEQGNPEFATKYKMGKAGRTRKLEK